MRPTPTCTRCSCLHRPASDDGQCEQCSIPRRITPNRSQITRKIMQSTRHFRYSDRIRGLASEACRRYRVITRHPRTAVNGISSTGALAVIVRGITVMVHANGLLRKITRDTDIMGASRESNAESQQSHTFFTPCRVNLCEMTFKLVALGMAPSPASSR